VTRGIRSSNQGPAGVGAGFGTRVVRQYEEDYVKAAWDQIGDVLEANRRIRAAQAARQIGASLYDRHLVCLKLASPERAYALTAPAHRRVCWTE